MIHITSKKLTYVVQARQCKRVKFARKKFIQRCHTRILMKYRGLVLNHVKVHVYSIPFSEEEVNLTVGTVFVMCAYKSEMNHDFENVFNNLNKLYNMIVLW